MNNKKKLCIVGAGGFGREVLSCFKDSYLSPEDEAEKCIVFLDDNPNLKNQTVMGIPVINSTDFDSSIYNVVVAIGDPSSRKTMVDSLPEETSYITLIHPTANVSDDCKIGVGSIITAGCTITCNITIGSHCHLNLHSTVGHDCEIGDYFTTAPGTHISGECHIGNCVYFGTNSSIRQGINVNDNITIGMGGVVVKNLIDSGVYVGSPAKKLQR